MTKELEEFNKKVIETLKSKTTEDGTGIAIPVLDVADKNIAVTQLYIDNNYQLAFVELEDDPDGKKSPTERVKDVYMLMQFGNVESTVKMNNWLNIIYNNQKVDEFQNKELNTLV